MISCGEIFVFDNLKMIDLNCFFCSVNLLLLFDE